MCEVSNTERQLLILLLLLLLLLCYEANQSACGISLIECLSNDCDPAAVISTQTARLQALKPVGELTSKYNLNNKPTAV